MGAVSTRHERSLPTKRNALRARSRCLLPALLIVGPVALAAPGDVLFEDDFESNLNAWSVSSSGGDASIGSETSEAGQSLRLRFGEVTITSDPFDAAVPAAQLDVWIRRGSDSFSENPDEDENLVVEYLNDVGTWIEVAEYLGDGNPGEVINLSQLLPSDALHAALQIRFTMIEGGPSPYDYWHIDNPTVTEIAPSGPFGVGSCTDFESGLGGWTVSSSGGDAGVGTATANSGSSSLYTRWNVVTVTSPAVDTSAAPGVELSIWVQRGDDNFSENPDSGEDLVVQYFNDSGSWVTLEAFPGGGSQGEVFDRSYTLPSSALHNAFQVRVRQLGGGGSDFDYWHIDDVCLTAATPTVLSYWFEESQWTGAAGEVLEESGSGLDGTVFGGADTAQSSPAIAGNPGSCRYADFDGVDDYIEIADDPALDLPNELTVGVWVNARSIPSSDLHSIVSKDWNYEFHFNSSGQVFWYWQNSSGSVRTLTGSTVLNTDQWYHIAIAYAAGSQVIYVDGSPVASSSFNETLRVNDESLYIGTDLNFISRAWDGFIDEVNIYDRALSQAEVQALMMETHPCGSTSPQFVINHDGYGINCQAETITVDVIDAISGTPILDYNATVELDTQSGRGSWQLVTGSGSLNDATTNDGIATYNWPLTESRAVFSLSYPEGTPVIDVDVFQQNDPGIRDTDGEGNLEFSASGFTVTSSPLSNPPPGVITTFDAAQTAGTDFALYITAFGQTPNDPACGVIEAYTGDKPLEFWLTRQNPATGSITATVDGSAIATNEGAATVTTVTFTNGQASVLAKYKDVGQVQVSLKDTSPADPDLASGIRGATAGFVVKPAEFRLSNILSGATSNPGAANAGGAAFIAAGEAFSATVTAYDAEGSVTPNYGQETTAEGVSLASNIVLPAAGNNPSLGSATGFGAFSGGSATGNNFSWAEVGIITLTPSVGDGDYLGAGDVSGQTSGNVGRFIPHHFETSTNVPTLATSCAAGSFTYIGEAFGYTTAPVITFTAKAQGGQTTVNYEGDFFKMSGLAAPTYTSTPATLDTSGLPGSGDPAVTESGSGVGTLTFSSGSGFFYTRGAEEPEFDADIRLSQVVADSDGAAALSNPVVFGNPGGMLFDAGAAQRYGRARILNAFGSERVNLAVTLRTEYYFNAATGFVSNVADDCSTPVTVALDLFTDNLADGETCVLDNGAPGLSGAGCAAVAAPAFQFREPSVAGNFNLNLRAPGDGNDGSARVSADVPAWLEYDWDAGSPGNEDPEANATFGVFQGQGRQIYTRELY